MIQFNKQTNGPLIGKIQDKYLLPLSLQEKSKYETITNLFWIILICFIQIIMYYEI